MAEWVVNTKGGPSTDSFEISVLRADNKHGKESYGWFGKAKLLVSHSGGPCRDKVSRQIWDKLVNVAEDVAHELNVKEAMEKANETQL